MRKYLTILTAGIIGLLSFNSCNTLQSDFDIRTCEAFLTCYYAGGLPSASAQQTYELKGPLNNREIEDIFYELSDMVYPGFIEASLEINFYDWMDNYMYTHVYDFWWEYSNHISEDGYYAWDERLD